FRRDGPPYGPPAFMDFDTFTRLLDQFPELEELQLQGLGEPMMHPRFFDMVAYAVARGIKVGTNTNLTLLNARRAEQCVTSGLAEDPGRIHRHFGEAGAVAAELGVDLRRPLTRPRLHPPDTPGPQRCDWPWRGAYVSYQGLAMPCCMVATPDRVQLGNMAKEGA